MKKEESKKGVDSNTKLADLNVREVKNEPSKTEIKGDRAKYVKVDESPLKGAKQHFADEFAREKERISGKPFKGEPTIEDAGDSPSLQKYYKNWTLIEA